MSTDRTDPAIPEQRRTRRHPAWCDKTPGEYQHYGQRRETAWRDVRYSVALIAGDDELESDGFGGAGLELHCDTESYADLGIDKGVVLYLSPVDATRMIAVLSQAVSEAVDWELHRPA